jgi:hypothetical protein
LEKLPSRLFHANWAYLLIGQLAFNLLAWFKRLVLPADYQQATAKTIRHHLLNVAGKIVRSARQSFLVLSDQYRYQHAWQFAIQKLAGLNFARRQPLGCVEAVPPPGLRTNGSYGIMPR